MTKTKTARNQMSAIAKEVVTDKPLLNVPETARFLGVSQSLVWAEIKRGALKPLRLGDRVLFSRVYLDRLCAAEAQQ